jgi:predicted nucleic acid-binding protein
MSNGHEANQQPLDVGAILEALRADLRAQRLARGRAEPSAAENELNRALDEIELHRVVSAHWPLIGKTLPQKIINLINKVVRRYLRWYINPIVEQQNAYNDAVARTLRLLADAYAELAEQNAALNTPTPPTPPSDGKPSAPPIVAPETSQAELTQQQHTLAAQEPPAALPDLALAAAIPQLRLHENVNAHWALNGATLPQKIIALVNKLVRRYLRWYINPIVEQQNAANAAFTVALQRLVAVDAERRAELAALRAKASGSQVQR